LHFVVRQISASSNGNLDGFIAWSDLDFDQGMAEIERLSDISLRRFPQLCAFDVLSFGSGGPRRPGRQQCCASTRTATAIKAQFDKNKGLKEAVDEEIAKFQTDGEESDMSKIMQYRCRFHTGHPGKSFPSFLTAYCPEIGLSGAE
jgi:hypothetical protein